MNGRAVFTRFITFNSTHSFSTSSACGWNLDHITCISILQQCANSKDLTTGKHLHSYMLKHNILSSSPLPTTSLINVYSKCNQLTLAFNLFDGFPDRTNIYIWNAMISGLVANGEFRNGFALYQRMRQEEGVFPDKFTFPVVIKACSDLLEVRKIHGGVFKLGLELDFFIGSALVNCYLKFGEMEEAMSVFEELLASDKKNIYIWNTVISGLVANGEFRNGFALYQRMRQEEGVFPDKFTFPVVIKACSDLLEVRKIHGGVFKLGLELDFFIGSALVNCYLKFGEMEEAKSVFEELPAREDVVLWNAMINGCGQIGKLDMVLDIFMRMCEERVVPNIFTVTGVLSAFAEMGELRYGKMTHGKVLRMGFESVVSVLNALVDMYGKCGRDEAFKIFEMIDEKDIFSWNSILTVQEQTGDRDGTLRIFNRMLRDGVMPDLVTVTTVLPACAHLAALMRGREFHGFMIVSGLGKDNHHNRDTGNAFMDNAVLDMYAKCGCMREARFVFDKMSVRDVASWNIMIKGYGMLGYGEEALDTFSQMCELKLNPDEVTFVGILSACSHSGFFSQGHEFLSKMESHYGVVPTIEHYACVIDMLGRAGRLDEAYNLAITMPIEANSVIWRAFLASCQRHRNKDLAEVAARKVFELEPEHCGNYVLMSNVYGDFGQYKEVSDTRNLMMELNVKKMTGYSWIELKDCVHKFVTADRAHPDAQKIYFGLNSLIACMCELEDESSSVVCSA